MSFPFPSQYSGNLPLNADKFLDRFREILQPAAEIQHDLRAAILVLLLEQPRHGYQIIQEITQRSNGAWQPTPGEVYPTLQLLVDEKLIIAEVSDSRKIYSLTDTGTESAAAAQDGAEQWSEHETGELPPAVALSKAGAKLAQASAQLLSNGNAAEIIEAAELLDNTRRKLYAILARD